MAEYLETHARRVYGATDTIDIIAAEAILTHIGRGNLKDGFTARDVHQRDGSRLTDRSHVQRGLDLLVDLDHLAEVVAEKKTIEPLKKIRWIKARKGARSHSPI